MTDINRVSSRPGTPAPGGSASSSTPAQQPPACAGQALDLQRLRNLRIPPANHPDFEIPALRAEEKNARIAELDMRLEFLRTYRGPGADDDEAEAWHEHHVASLKTTREAVLAFMNDGQCPHGDAGFQALALFLLNNRLPDALSWLVLQSGAGRLNLNRCGLGAAQLAMVADWARNVPFPVRLDLSGNHIDGNGAALLAGALSADTIAHLDLGNNPLDDKGAQALGAALHGNTSLQSLALCHTSINNSGVEAIAGALDTHPALAVLVLDGNRFDDQGAATLASALGRNRTLLRLSVRFSQLSDVGLSYLADALAINTCLRSLKLFGKDDEECVHLPYALAGALLVNRSLTTLLLFVASMPEAGARRLAAAVAVNTTLREFELGLGAYTNPNP
ncbi:hypothetical protein [Noviherbaspirillum suwonense]|uniref:Leucine Rich repeat-containing protein n=1 Tax=Noviherbaspirillum suwonense TaxID=1224511 RepID=A0ABY1Q346_9BURK|nr:hypothetical protein [Noviherbaspirillum suwonense]SMP57720.1 Leucine Rich repeat-containing protein [Noviherbaspirillum suwonense]